MGTTNRLTHAAWEATATGEATCSIGLLLVLVGGVKSFKQRNDSDGALETTMRRTGAVRKSFHPAGPVCEIVAPCVPVLPFIGIACEALRCRESPGARSISTITTPVVVPVSMPEHVVGSSAV